MNDEGLPGARSRLAGTSARALAPWLDSLAELEAWLPPGTPLQALRAVLQALARGEVGIPRDMPVGLEPGRSALDQWLRPDPGQALEAMRRRRQDVLRLGLWRVLRLHQRAVPDGLPQPTLAALHARIGRRCLPVPPGLGPALDYAVGAAAPAFFDSRLRDALRCLGARCDALGADYAALADEAPFEATAADVQAWSGVWTAAVAGVYLDWLDHQNAGQVEAALRSLWRDGAAQVGFRASAALAVLPSRDRSLHIDLWVDAVLAQALDHQPARWQAADRRRWHRVPLRMHDLGQQTRGSRARGEQRTVCRGLGVELLYQAVFVNRVEEVLTMRHADTTDTAVAHGDAPPRIDLVLPLPRPGHDASFQLVVHWQRGGDVLAAPRFVDPPAGHVLNARQRAIFETWRRQRAATQAQRWPASALDWHAADGTGLDGDAVPADGDRALLPLGRAAFWSRLDAGLLWLDLAVLVCVGGRWHDLPVRQHDALVDGVQATWLLVAPEPPAWCAAGDWSRQVRRIGEALAADAAACWVLRAAGVGVFVLAAVDLDRVLAGPLTMAGANAAWQVAAARAWLALRLDRHADAAAAFADAQRALGATASDDLVLARAELLAGEADARWELGLPLDLVERLRAALAVLQGLPASPRATAAAAWLQLALGRLLMRQRALAEALQILRAAQQDAAVHAAPLLQARIEGVLATVLALSGRPSDALGHSMSALARLGDVQLAGWVRDRMRLTANMGGMLAELGRLQAAEQAYLEAIGLAQGLAASEPAEAGAELARLRRNLGVVRMRMGRHDAAIAELRPAVDGLARLLQRRDTAALKDPALWRASLAGAQMNLGYAHFLHGDLAEAGIWLQRAVRGLARLGRTQAPAREELVRTRVNQAHLAARLGQDARALALYRRGVRDFTALLAEGRRHCAGDRVNASLGLARLQLRQGQALRAAAVFEAALQDLVALTREGQLQQAQSWLAAWLAQADAWLVQAPRGGPGLDAMLAALERTAARAPQRPAVAGREPVLVLQAALDHWSAWRPAASDDAGPRAAFDRLAAAGLRILFDGASVLLADADPQWLHDHAAEVDALVARLRDAAASQPAAARLLADWFFATHGLRAQRIALTLGAAPEIAALRTLLLDLHALEHEMLGAAVAEPPRSSAEGGRPLQDPLGAGGATSALAWPRAQAWQALHARVDALRLQLVQQGLLPGQLALHAGAALDALGPGEAVLLLARVDADHLLGVLLLREPAGAPLAEHRLHALDGPLRDFGCAALNRMARQAVLAGARRMPVRRAPVAEAGTQAATQEDVPPAGADDGADLFAQELFTALWHQVLAPAVAGLAARGCTRLDLVPADDLHLVPWSHLAAAADVPLQLGVYPSGGAWLRGRQAGGADGHAPARPPRWVLASGAALDGPRPLPWVDTEQRLSARLWGDALCHVDLAPDARPHADGVDALLGMGHGGSPDGNPAHAALAIDGAMLSAHDLPQLRTCRRALLSACVLGQTRDAHGEPLGFLSACFDYRATFAAGWLTEVPDRAACLFSLAAQWALRAVPPERPRPWSAVLRDLRGRLAAGQWPAGFGAWLQAELPGTALDAPPPDLLRVLPWLLVLGD